MTDEQPYKPGQPINKMFAWIATEADGGEGIIAMLGNDGQWMPLVGADGEKMESLRDYAKTIAHATGRPIQLVEFATRKNLGPP